MDKFIITPHIFLDLFCTCLLWYEDKAKGKQHECYTVDGISRILEEMGVINKIQRKSLYKDTRLQRLFMNSIVVLPSYCRYKDYVDFGNRVKKLMEKALLELRQDPSKNINPQRLLRDYRLSLTEKGKRYAISNIEKYSHVISEINFLETAERLNTRRESGMGAIMRNYKNKVEKETKDGKRRTGK